MKAIEIAELSKEYRGKKRTGIQALKGLTLQVEKGEVFGFLGPNGAGKSTTIKILTGQISASSGDARVWGESVRSPEARKNVGYLPENPAFYDFMTPREYLRFVGRIFAKEDAVARQRTDEVLEMLSLQGAANRPIRGFSKGMVQRMGMAQALFHDPEIFILDEPMSGLDPMGRALVKDIIKDLKCRGKTVFFSTHITADVEVVCDRLGVVVDGRLMALDSVQNVLRSGVEGYVLQFSLPGEPSTEVYVAENQLQPKLEQILSAGGSVERLEPKRQDLEAFFLNVVARANYESSD